MSVNKVILVGNLGQDPESKTTGGGTTVASLSLATSERRKSEDKWEEATEWHKVVSFGKVAENAARFLKKGSKVYVEGKLRTRKWQDKNGQDRYTTEVVADTIQFLDRKSEEPKSYSDPAPDADIPF